MPQVNLIINTEIFGKLKQPKDGPSIEKKQKPYDPTAGGIVNSPRRNQTPDIKPNLGRTLPNNKVDEYDPWGKGAGNPDRDGDGYIQPRNQTLDAGRVNFDSHICEFMLKFGFGILLIILEDMIYYSTSFPFVCLFFIF